MDVRCWNSKQNIYFIFSHLIISKLSYAHKKKKRRRIKRKNRTFDCNGAFKATILMRFFFCCFFQWKSFEFNFNSIVNCFIFFFIWIQMRWTNCVRVSFSISYYICLLAMPFCSKENPNSNTCPFFSILYSQT